MTLADVLSLLAIVVSIINCIVSYTQAQSAKKSAADAIAQADKALKTVDTVAALAALAQVELMMEERLATAEAAHLECLEHQIVLHQDPTCSRDRFTFVVARVNALRKNYCNAMEACCALYVDGKIDKSRFKKSHGTAVVNLVKSYKEDYISESQSAYKATLKALKDFDIANE